MTTSPMSPEATTQRALDTAKRLLPQCRGNDCNYWRESGHPDMHDPDCPAYYRPAIAEALQEQYDTVAELQARIAVLEGDEWQLIETAPMDGKDRIDLFDANRRQRAPDCYFHRKAQRWMSKHHDAGGYSVLRLPFKATHWRRIRLPTALSPAPASTEGEKT